MDGDQGLEDVAWPTSRSAPPRPPEQRRTTEGSVVVPDLLDHSGGGQQEGGQRERRQRDGATGRALAATDRARAVLGFDQRTVLDQVRTSVLLEVDREGTGRSLTQRATWRALDDDVAAFPVVTLLPAPVRRRVRLEALRGCAPGPRYFDLAEGLFSAAFAFPLPLARGQEAETVHRVRLSPVEGGGQSDAEPGGAPLRQGSFEQQVHGPVEEVRIEVAFAPGCAPRAGEVQVRTEAGEHSEVLTADGGSLTWAGTVRGAGVVGVRWRW